jgi:hypothetical protein
MEGKTIKIEVCQFDNGDTVIGYNHEKAFFIVLKPNGAYTFLYPDDMKKPYGLTEDEVYYLAHEFKNPEDEEEDEFDRNHDDNYLDTMS